ncbi:hypothetical protein [Ottowia sp.]|uniref:hypothetical protein n=1 Tax=Ottowia sp. TaxID=1898956 RepID=UPI003A868394
MLQQAPGNNALPADAMYSPATSAQALPNAQTLVEAMTGCCHPRAGRLAERLLSCDQPETLRQLQGDVLNLLVLSFGPAEAQRRLQAHL